MKPLLQVALVVTIALVSVVTIKMPGGVKL
jgi:hypothetical protein